MAIFDLLFGKKRESSFKAKTKENINELEDQNNVKELILALKHNELGQRQKAAEALCKVGDKQAVEPLTKALLKDEAWVVRRYAAEALGNIGVPQVVGPLTSALNNDPYVCDITGRRVVRLIAEEALKKIEKAKTAKEPLDRLLACQWSSSSPSKEITALIEILKRNCKSILDREVSKCVDAIKKLEEEKSPVVAEVMCYAALAANHYEVRNSAANVLKGIMKPEINQILCNVLHYDREVYRPVSEALNALKIIGDSSMTSAIANFLDDFRKTWRMKGDTAVSGMGAAMTLGANLDKEKSICLSACRALAELGGSEAITAIKAVLSDSYWSNYDEIREELPKLIAQTK